MRRAHSDPHRLDIPRTIRELYPDSRSRARLLVTRPGEMRNSDRWLRWLRRGVEGCIFVIVAVPLLLLRLERLGVELAQSVAGRTGATMFATSTQWWAWQRWARVRGARRLDAPTPNALVTPKHCELPAGDVPAYQVLVGARRVGVEVCAVAVKGSGATHHGGYVASVRLPAGVAERFPGSSLRRRHGLSLIDELDSRGRQLPLESIRLLDGTMLHVEGGDELDWRQLMDPALVDLLAEGVHVEWHQRGDELLLHAAAPMAAVEAVEGERMDGLAVAAAAIERRFATVAGNGRALPAAPVEWVARERTTRRRRHLRSERRRDLELAPEELFAELARYVSAEELARVRAQVDAGTFPLDWLDDLVHHRRARFWGEDGDAAAPDPAAAGRDSDAA